MVAKEKKKNRQTEKIYSRIAVIFVSLLFFLLLLHPRIKFPFIRIDMDSDVTLAGQYVYCATTGWHTNICSIDYITDDLFHWTIANFMVAWFSNGHTERCPYGQFDGQSWHIGKASIENCDRSSAHLSFWLYGILFGRHGCSSVFLLRFGMFFFSHQDSIHCHLISFFFNFLLLASFLTSFIVKKRC